MPAPETLSADAQTRLRAELLASRSEVAVLRARLAEREQLLEGLDRHVPGGLMVLDRLPNGHRRIPYASEGLFTLFDLDPALREDPEALFAQLVARIHPSHLYKVQQWEAEAEAGARELNGDVLIGLRNGEQRWVAMQLGVQFSEQGHRIWYGMIQDVTQRQQMAQRLEARDALLRSLGRNLPGILYKLVIPPGGEPQLQYISAQVARLYGFDTLPEAPNWNLHFDRVHPDDLAHVKALMNVDGQDTSRPLPYEYRIIVPGKGVRWLAGQAMPMREPDGTLAWYGYTADVTEQKLYAEALISAQAAEDASRAKSEFLSRMSHELRTPLNAVLGFAQLLRMDRSSVFGEEQRSRVALIEKAGQHLLAMLGDVLDLSRIEAGSLPLSMESLDLGQVVDEATQLVSELARRHRIHLDTGALSPHLHVQADRVRLRQVLVNLLGNAIKYNRPDGEVRVRSQAHEDEVLIEVSDTGIGLSPAQQAHLFEPFNRLGAERTGVEGTGIGLVIVRRLIALMHGRMDVTSAPGQGSTFRLTLPLAEQPPLPSEHGVWLDLPAQPQSATILYAEDNEVNIMLVQQVLTLRPGWRLLVGTSGQRALELARRSPPDLMLIDMHLGDMTGFELADALDREPHLRNVPRVALSADAMPDRIHAARNRGFRAYLTKPLDVMALLRCLDEQLHRS